MRTDARRLGAMTTDLGTPRVLPSDEAERAVLLAAPRGYCAGVDRAVVTVEKALDLYGVAGLRPQADRAQQARRGRPRVARCDLRRGARRGAGRRHRRLLRARCLARGAPTGRGARAQDHRRDLPAGDQGAPRGEAVRRRRLRHPAHRPRRPRGGRGHRRRGARAHPARREPRRRRRHRGPRPGEGGLALPDDAVGRRDARDRGRDPGAVPAAARPAERRHLLRHPEPPARGQGDLPRLPTW